MTSALKVHFSGESTTPACESSQPTTIAKNALKASLQALHEDICDLDTVTGTAEKFLNKFFNLKSKVKSLSKFDDETYVPISCRVKIELKGSREIRHNEKFKELAEKTQSDISNFQSVMTTNMKDALSLEIKCIQHELMTKVVTFTDMLMKHQLFTRDACREHLKSNSLSIRVFFAQDGSPSGDKTAAELLFGCTAVETYTAMQLNPTSIGSATTSTDTLTGEECKAILEVRKSIRDTLGNAIAAYNKQLKRNTTTAQIKEALKLKVLTEVADETADILNNKEIELPKNVDELKDLFKQVIVEHEKNKEKEPNVTSVKDGRGANAQQKKGKKSRKNQKNQNSKKTNNPSGTSLKTNRTPTQRQNQQQNQQSTNSSRKRKNNAQAEDAEPDSGKGKKSRNSTKKSKKQNGNKK